MLAQNIEYGRNGDLLKPNFVGVQISNSKLPKAVGNYQSVGLTVDNVSLDNMVLKEICTNNDVAMSKFYSKQ